MSKPITYLEYRRRVYNAALLECLCKLHSQVLGKSNDARIGQMAAQMCNKFFTEELNLKSATVNLTKKRLCESAYFIREAEEVAEQIADQKTEDAKEEKLEITDDQDVELSQEDKAVIDNLFYTKSPTTEVEKIRDATISALQAEDQKAQEIKDAMDIAKAQVSSGENEKAVDEAVKRINAIGPTSLMNAIITNVTSHAINVVTEAGNYSSVSKVMQENADEIKTRAVVIYSLYEMASVMGIHKYTPNEVKKIAHNIYYEKY